MGPRLSADTNDSGTLPHTRLVPMMMVIMMAHCHHTRRIFGSLPIRMMAHCHTRTNERCMSVHNLVDDRHWKVNHIHRIRRCSTAISVVPSKQILLQKILSSEFWKELRMLLFSNVVEKRLLGKTKCSGTHSASHDAGTIGLSPLLSAEFLSDSRNNSIQLELRCLFFALRYNNEWN